MAAICPKNSNDMQPTKNCSAQIAPAKVIISAELLTQPIGAEQWNLGISLQSETPPNEPKIQIETTWRIDQGPHNIQIRRHRMLADFIPKRVAESDDVVARRGFAGRVVVHVPKPHVIEEGEPREFPNRTVRKTVISAKVDGAREYPLKSFNEPPVMLPVTRQTEFFEHFGPGTKVDASALLPYCKRSDPDWNEPILPKGKSEIGMSLDL
jgi:hypothetical protein